MKHGLSFGIAVIFLALSSASADDACEAIAGSVLKDIGATDANGAPAKGVTTTTRIATQLVNIAGQWKIQDAKITSSDIEGVFGHSAVRDYKDAGYTGDDSAARADLIQALTPFSTGALTELKKLPTKKMYDMVNYFNKKNHQTEADTGMWLAHSYLLDQPYAKDIETQIPIRPGTSAAVNFSARAANRFYGDNGLQKLTLTDLSPPGAAYPIGGTDTTIEFAREGNGCRISKFSTRGMDFDMTIDRWVDLNATNCAGAAATKPVLAGTARAVLQTKAEKAFGPNSEASGDTEKFSTSESATQFNSELSLRQQLCDRYAKFMSFPAAGPGNSVGGVRQPAKSNSANGG
jgi:hypothetical protein